jgi:hypothetical protein
MATIGSLDVDLTLQTAAFQRDMGKAVTHLNSNVARMSRSLKGLEGGFFAVTRIAGTFGVALGLGALVSFAKRSLDAAGGLGELAEQMGTTTRNLQIYEYGAVQAGVRTEELRAGLQRLTRSLGDAANGEKQALDAFNALGIGVLDQNGKLRSTDDVLRDLADAYKNSADKATFVASAARLGGRSFQQLLPLLSGGAAGLDAMGFAAQTAGAVLDDQLIKQADEASDKIAAMDKSLGRMAQTVVSKAAPAIGALADEIARAFGPRNEQQIGLRLAELEKRKPHTLSPIERDEMLNLRALQDAMTFGAGGGVPAPAGAGGPTSNPPAKGAGKSEADKIAKVVENLQHEQEQLGRTAAEIDLYNNLKAAGVDLNSAAGQQIADLTASLQIEKAAWEQTKAATEAQDDAIMKLVEDAASISEATRTPMEQYQASLARANELLQEGVVSHDTYTRQVERLQDELARTDPLLKALEDSSRDFGNTLTAAFEDAIIEGKSLGEVVRALLQDIARLALRATTSKLISAGIGALVGAFAGPGAGYGASAGVAGISGAYAAGGRPSVGKWALVGEQGPELFRPDVAGTIIPNGSFGGGGVALTIGKIEVKVPQGTTPDQAAGIARAMRTELENVTLSLLHREMRPGGMLAG